MPLCGRGPPVASINPNTQVRKTLTMQAHTGPTALRVLLVDDDSIVLELVSLLLAAKDIQVVRAAGGQEALDLLKSLSPLPDIVLVDHQMPGVSGVDVARYVKSISEPRPRVIAMSASPLPEDDLAIFDDFLHKPVDQDMLRAAITGSKSATPPRAKLPPSLDSSTVTKLQAIMPPSAIHELYTVYVADTRQRISDLERYSANGDEESLRRCAHALKGAAAMAGVPGIASIAAGLETGHLPRRDHGKLFHQLRSACDDVEQTMIKSAVTNSVASGEAR
jgi:CheY-like chemotaxis protein/HPt (histidine-containing phosphotransfer) domain-containing protein